MTYAVSKLYVTSWLNVLFKLNLVPLSARNGNFWQWLGEQGGRKADSSILKKSRVTKSNEYHGKKVRGQDILVSATYSLKEAITFCLAIFKNTSFLRLF